MPDALLEKTRAALESALGQSGGVRLIAKGAKIPGLFPGGKNKEVAAAIAQCRSDELFTFAEIEEKKGKTTAKAEFATMTAKGIAALFSSTDSVRRLDLLAAVSPDHRAMAEEACVVAFNGELKTQRDQLDAILAKESDLAFQLRTFLETRLATFAAARSRIDLTIRDSENAIAAIASPPPELPTATKPPLPPKPVEPRDEQDLDFQRDLSEQLVIAWKDAGNPEAKELFETVMFNLGIEQLGERGKIIPFDQTTQIVDEPLDRGEPVEVLEPGWRLTSPRGSYLISRTKVCVVKVQ